MNEYLVSVIVPVYNVQDYIEDCIASLVGQTYKNIEIILVDDGSTDACAQICDTYANEYSNIIVIHKENGGLSDARNVGIREAKGRYILLVDSDDYVNKSMIERMIQCAEENSSDIVACEYEKTLDGRKINDVCKSYEKASNYSGEEILKQLYDGNMGNIAFVSVCKLFKKNIFIDNSIWFPKGRYYEDTFTTHKLLINADIVSVLKYPLYYYRTREGSITQSQLTMKKVIDGLDADAESIRTFNGTSIQPLAFKSFCHSQFKRFLEIEASNCCEKDKKELQREVHAYFVREYKLFSRKHELPLRYRIVGNLFMLNPFLAIRIIK